jgi:predicted phosphodiesterase
MLLNQAIMTEPDTDRIALFGGVYNNHVALQALIDDARRKGIGHFYCLGDLGAFGPFPDKVFPILRENRVTVVQGNYDHSIGNDLSDCRCGYTDPRDNYFAQISYDYTQKNTSTEFKAWQKALPEQIRLKFNSKKLLLCHGSPRMTNEFLWESTTSSHFLAKQFDDYDADILLTTHTGLHWQRTLESGKQFINVGVIGRPENDGKTNVWYAILSAEDDVKVEFVPLFYDERRLAEGMASENLPAQFIETILTGWWTTCLEVLPARERVRGKF